MVITKSKLVTWMSRVLLGFRCTFSMLLRQSLGNQLKRTSLALTIGSTVLCPGVHSCSTRLLGKGALLASCC